MADRDFSLIVSALSRLGIETSGNGKEGFPPRAGLSPDSTIMPGSSFCALTSSSTIPWVNPI